MSGRYHHYPVKAMPITCAPRIAGVSRQTGAPMSVGRRARMRSTSAPAAMVKQFWIEGGVRWRDTGPTLGFSTRPKRWFPTIRSAAMDPLRANPGSCSERPTSALPAPPSGASAAPAARSPVCRPLRGRTHQPRHRPHIDRRPQVSTALAPRRRNARDRVARGHRRAPPEPRHRRRRRVCRHGSARSRTAAR